MSVVVQRASVRLEDSAHALNCVDDICPLELFAVNMSCSALFSAAISPADTRESLRSDPCVRADMTRCSAS